MTTILDKEIDLWTAFTENRYFQLCNASVCHEPRLRREYFLNKKVLDSMIELRDYLQQQKDLGNGNNVGCFAEAQG